MMVHFQLFRQAVPQVIGSGAEVSEAARIFARSSWFFTPA
jgi:hypothetical protein